MKHDNFHTHWARLFMNALAQAGLRRVVISPGSRSTPLVLAAQAEPLLETYVVADERSAGFFALGQARLDGKPSALLCTSGSALSHYCPAAVEANMSNIPLLIISADRPWWEMHQGANQTVDQVKPFGDHVRQFLELGQPERSRQALLAAQRFAALAMHAAAGTNPGPVHINARFAKPLEPVPESEDSQWAGMAERLMQQGPTVVCCADASVNESILDELSAVISSTPNGIIACGPSVCGQDAAALREAVFALSEQTGYPVLAESTSQVRFGQHPVGGFQCEQFTSLFEIPNWRKRAQPDVIVEINGSLTSQAYYDYVSEMSACKRYVISPYRWNDPCGGASRLIFDQPERLITALLGRLAPTPAEPSELQTLFVEANRVAGETIASRLSQGGLSAGTVVRYLSEHLPAGCVVMVGNSLMVRDMDRFSSTANFAPGQLLHQRGASGIDGMISGAAGSASVADAPVVLITGDVSAHHDLTGLRLCAGGKHPVLAIVINNNGGRIFEQLPLAKCEGLEDTLERSFVASGAPDLSQAASMYGIDYRAVRELPDLAKGLEDSFALNNSTVIEVFVEYQTRKSDLSSLRSHLAEKLL